MLIFVFFIIKRIFYQIVLIYTSLNISFLFYSPKKYLQTSLSKQILYSHFLLRFLAFTIRFYLVFIFYFFSFLIITCILLSQTSFSSFSSYFLFLFQFKKFIITLKCLCLKDCQVVVSVTGYLVYFLIQSYYFSWHCMTI